MPEIELVQGDITEQDTDAIVNAANRSLLGGGGVDGAIHRRGGPEILAACKEIRKTKFPDGLPTGKAVATPGGKLQTRFVIHTVGPIYSKSSNPARDLANSYTESLKVADGLGARSVAFPAISTGVYGYPVQEAAAVAIKAVRQAKTKVELVRFVLFDERSFTAFRKAAEAT
jgi:O-acetyl-ADP-ribose deacetylase (regulator of RNase III)